MNKQLGQDEQAVFVSPRVKQTSCYKLIYMLYLKNRIRKGTTAKRGQFQLLTGNRILL